MEAEGRQPLLKQRRYEPQQPCPECGEPMSGLGWRTTCHHEDGLQCPDASHWIGPWGHCTKCSSEQIALAVEKRIADELERIADGYIENAFEDVWSWTGKLAKRVRDGEFTKPLPNKPPF